MFSCEPPLTPRPDRWLIMSHPIGAKISARGLDPEHRSKRFVGQRVEEAVRTGLDLADALLQLRQKNLAARRLALRIEEHALNVLAGVVAHRADKRVALPRGKRVAVVDRQPGDGNRRHPEDDRLLEPGLREAVADDGAVVVAAE